MHDQRSQDLARERRFTIAMAIVGAVVLLGLGATGSLVLLITGVVLWAVLSVLVWYLLLLRPRLQAIRARRGQGRPG